MSTIQGSVQKSYVNNCQLRGVLRRSSICRDARSNGWSNAWNNGVTNCRTFWLDKWLDFYLASLTGGWGSQKITSLGKKKRGGASHRFPSRP